MGSEILTACDRLLAAAINGIYQGVIITVLVALSLRALHRTNAATRHGVWLCTLVLLVALVAAHYFVDSLPFARQPTEIPAIEANPKQEIDSPTLVAVPASAISAQTGIASSAPYLPDHRAPEQAPPLDQRRDSISLTSLEALPSDEVELSTGNLVSLGALPSGGNPPSPPVATDHLPASNADNQSVSFYKLMRRLANPVSTTLALESPAARIGGIIILGSWLALASVRIGVLLVRLHQIRKLKLQSLPPSASLNKLFQNLVSRLDIGRNVELKISPASHSAFLLGFFHPVILLPGQEPMEPMEAEQILHHELAHVRRRDDWVNLVQHFILAAFPLHPAVWWVSRQMSLEREIACDDYVLQSSGHPRAYALLLANLAARLQRCPPLLAPGASNNKTQLQQRIDMILNTQRNASPRLAATWLALITSAAVLFAAAVICSAPRVVLAQSDPAPAAANAPGNTPVAAPAPAPGIAIVKFVPAAPDADSADEVPAATPKAAAISVGPKFKPGDSKAVYVQPLQPAEIPGHPVPVVPAAPASLSTPPAPSTPPGAYFSSADSSPKPRPGRTPQPARARAADSSLEERLQRLERMIESLMARQAASHWEQSAEKDGMIDRKQIARIETHAKRQADVMQKQMIDAKEIEKIKEQAKHEARAVEQFKRATADAEKGAKAAQRRQISREPKDASKRQLEALRKQIEILERERERLDRQIEQLERDQEQLDDQLNDDGANDVESEEAEANCDPSPAAHP